MSYLSIRTTQNVNLNFQTASLGDRILAFFIDLIIRIAYIILVAYFIDGFNLKDYFFNGNGIYLFIVLLSPFLFYSFILESIFEGQTFGKKIIKIKVVKIDGYQASKADFFVRWFLRIIDISISSGLIGVISIILSSKSQRIGDIVSGTSVISLKSDINLGHTILEEISTEYIPSFPSVILFSDRDMQIIKDVFGTAKKKQDSEIAYKLRKKIESVAQISKPDGMQDFEFVQIVLKDYNYYTQGK